MVLIVTVKISADPLTFVSHNRWVNFENRSDYDGFQEHLKYFSYGVGLMFKLPIQVPEIT